jgi:Transglutaminase-like superfamily
MTPVSQLTVAVRLWIWAALLRPLKYLLPLDSLVRLAHVRVVANAPRSREFEHALEGYLASTDRFPRRAPGNCLERSLGAYRLLCAANASPTLMVGLKRSTASQVQGHVWVVVDGRALAERPENVSTYTTIVAFDSHGRQEPAGGSTGALAGIRFA